MTLVKMPRPTIRLFLRGVIFNAWMGGSALVMGMICLPMMLFTPTVALAAVRIWCRLNVVMVRMICGVRVEIRGLEKLSSEGVLIAAKHHGMLDTIAPFDFLAAPAIVLKKELLSIPIYGWYAARTGMLPIDRTGGAVTLRALIKTVRERFNEGRQVIIFPEGTRVAPGAAPDYKPGIAALYKELGIACCPVATNSGLHWPAKGLIRYPGVVVFEILDPIPAGLKRAEFMRELQARIETATNRLIADDQSV